jgi:hypothetical protein
MSEDPRAAAQHPLRRVDDPPHVTYVNGPASALGGVGDRASDYLGLLNVSRLPAPPSSVCAHGYDCNVAQTTAAERRPRCGCCGLCCRDVGVERVRAGSVDHSWCTAHSENRTPRCTTTGYIALAAATVA